MARDLVVRIIGDSSSLERSLKRSEKATRQFQVGIAGGIGRTAASFVGISSAVVLANRAIRASAQEFAEQQRVAAQTAAVLKSTGGVAHVTADEVARLAEEIRRYSGIDDEAVQSAENLLLTFKNVRNEVGEGNRVFERATKAAVDLSVAGFGSLDSTAKQLGKALNDPVRGMTALGRAGVTFTAAQKATIRSLVETGRTLEAQRLILDEVESQVGDSARAYGDTLPGKIARAQTALENIGGEIAGSLAPAVERGAELVIALADAFDKLGAALDKIPDAGFKRRLDEMFDRVPALLKLLSPLGPASLLFGTSGAGQQGLAGPQGLGLPAPPGPVGPQVPKKTAAEIARAFQLPGAIRLAQARALVTQSLADDVAVAKRIKAFIEARIDAGTLKGQRLIDALGELAAANSVITSAIDAETAKRKAAADKEADARKKAADAARAAAERIAARTEEFRQRIGALFQGPILAPDDAQRRAALGLTAGPDPRQLLADIRAQNQGFRAFRNSLTRLTRAGAPGGLVNELLAGGLSAQAAAIAGAPRAIQQAIFRAFRQREALARQAAERPIRLFLRIDLDGKPVVRQVVQTTQRNAQYQANQRRGPGAGSVAVKPA